MSFTQEQVSVDAKGRITSLLVGNTAAEKSNATMPPQERGRVGNTIFIKSATSKALNPGIHGFIQTQRQNQITDITRPESGHTGTEACTEKAVGSTVSNECKVSEPYEAYNVRHKDIEGSHCHGTRVGDNNVEADKLPSACIFVANLNALSTDLHLTSSLLRFFGHLGKMHIKIRRDTKGNPYSFCQFENEAIARSAIKCGHGAVIDESGRPIRCEPAKLNRTLLIFRTDNAIFDKEEAFGILAQRDKVESFHPASEALPGSLGIRNGAYVTFNNRTEAVEAHKVFKNSPIWSCEWAPIAFESVFPPSQPVLSRPTIDPYSIFVGRLSPTLKREEIYDSFVRYGEIAAFNFVIAGDSQSDGNKLNYAFVRYKNQYSTWLACHYENGRCLMGIPIIVKIREVRQKQAERGGTPRKSISYSAPKPLPTTTEQPQAHFGPRQKPLTLNNGHHSVTQPSHLIQPRVADQMHSPQYSQYGSSAMVLPYTASFDQNMTYQYPGWYIVPPIYYYGPYPTAFAMTNTQMRPYKAVTTEGAKKSHRLSLAPITPRSLQLYDHYTGHNYAAYNSFSGQSATPAVISRL